METILVENEKEQLMGPHLNSKCKISNLPTLQWRVHTSVSETWNLVLKLSSGGKINSHSTGWLPISKRSQARWLLPEITGVKEVEAGLSQSQAFLYSFVKPCLPARVKAMPLSSQVPAYPVQGLVQSSYWGRKISRCKMWGISGPWEP